ncbi:hypothetical protein POM88_021220 [Heracleum sosnowskyi]|uniref:Retrotransposon gag domain-containing protein n=1 Tax=Heracleum sosnowskyi TaxID=360622 RepID=A0AAD8IGH1_9APIA|nr:hypothetical protein POM88_021220 [Heracleum sosnowskyi]
MPRSTEEVDTTPPSPNSGITLQQFIDQRRKEKQQKLLDSKIKMADLPIKSLKNYSQPSPSAQKWLNDINLTEWEEIAQAFLTEFFPPNRTDELVDKMTAFKQEYGESLRDAWERFKDLQRACPHHGLEKWFLLKRFYNGLDPETKGTVDNAAGGVFLDKGVDEAHNFLANLAANHFSNPRALRKGGKLEVDAYSLLSSQLAALTQEISSLKTTQTSTHPPPMSINALSSMAPMNNPVCENLPNQQQQYQQSYQHPSQQQYRPSQGPMNPPRFQKPSQNYVPQTSQAAQPDQTSDMMKILIQMIDVIDEIVQDELPQVLLNDTLEAVLMLEASEGEGHAEVDSLILELDGLLPLLSRASAITCYPPFSTSHITIHSSSLGHSPLLHCSATPLQQQQPHNINYKRGFLPRNHLGFLLPPATTSSSHLHRSSLLRFIKSRRHDSNSAAQSLSILQEQPCKSASSLTITASHHSQKTQHPRLQQKTGVFFFRQLHPVLTSFCAMGRGSSTRSSSPPKKKKKQSSVAPSSVELSSAAPSSKTSTVVSQRYPAVNTVGGNTTLSLEIVAELSHKLEKVGWTDLFIMDEPSYATLTYEFLSSFTVTSEGSLSFRIGNQSHVITKAELATMFGWQLVEQHPLPEDYATPFWLKITGLPSTESYKAQSAYASSIISHCYLYFDHLLSFTMFGRAESNNKIQTGELALLYYFDAELSVDWTSLLIERFLYHAHKCKGALVMGGFITRIAEELAIFDRSTTNLKVVDGWSSELDAEYLIGMKMLRRSGKVMHVVPHKHYYVEPREELAEPVQTLEEQVAELKANQIQIIQSQERMGKQLDDISASIQRYFSDPTP